MKNLILLFLIMLSCSYAISVSPRENLLGENTAFFNDFSADFKFESFTGNLTCELTLTNDGPGIIHGGAFTLTDDAIKTIQFTDMHSGYNLAEISCVDGVDSFIYSWNIYSAKHEILFALVISICLILYGFISALKNEPLLSYKLWLSLFAGLIMLLSINAISPLIYSTKLYGVALFILTLIIIIANNVFGQK